MISLSEKDTRFILSATIRLEYMYISDHAMTLCLAAYTVTKRV